MHAKKERTRRRQSAGAEMQCEVRGQPVASVSYLLLSHHDALPCEQGKRTPELPDF
jgi:hypothetical protein